WDDGLLVVLGGKVIKAGDYAARNINNELRRLPGVGPQLSHEVVPGVLPYSLDAALKQRQPELLALGRHSRNALMQALLGNLAQRY
ncbi:hypothetical protein IBT50_26995, partial [Bacillus sp. S70]|uniref:hypothetical protein n=1 Tax=Bacillus sp. S70 TaxID=1226988 RepID=UPI00190C3839